MTKSNTDKRTDQFSYRQLEGICKGLIWANKSLLGQNQALRDEIKVLEKQYGKKSEETL